MVRIVAKGPAPRGELRGQPTPASAGVGEKLCGKTAREEALVDGVYCPLCPGHATELAREDAEARGESAPMAVAASPRKMTKAKCAWQPRSPREIARIDVAVQKAIESPRCPDYGNTAVVRGSAGHGDEEFGCGRCGQRWEPASCFDDVDPIASCKRMTAR